MKRRTFIKGAGAVVGGFLLPFGYHREVDITPFCEHPVVGRGRFDLTKPFLQHDAVWATDGRIIVRTLTPGVETDGDARVPDCGHLVPDDTGKWKPWPREGYVAHSGDFGGVCPICEGFGRIGREGIKECTECNGEGFGWDGDADWPADNPPKSCTACQGTGHTGGEFCDYCKGQELQKTLQPIGGLGIQAMYDRKIRQLSNVHYRLQEYPHVNPDAREWSKSRYPMQLVSFRFDGGCGLLCPLEGGGGPA